ncbi:unnamed protein product, partial [Cuscuta europaea]
MCKVITTKKDAVPRITRWCLLKKPSAKVVSEDIFDNKKFEFQPIVPTTIELEDANIANMWTTRNEKSIVDVNAAVEKVIYESDNEGKMQSRIDKRRSQRIPKKTALKRKASSKNGKEESEIEFKKAKKSTTLRRKATKGKKGKEQAETESQSNSEQDQFQVICLKELKGIKDTLKKHDKMFEQILALLLKKGYEIKDSGKTVQGKKIVQEVELDCNTSSDDDTTEEEYEENDSSEQEDVEVSDNSGEEKDAEKSGEGEKDYNKQDVVESGEEEDDEESGEGEKNDDKPGAEESGEEKDAEESGEGEKNDNKPDAEESDESGEDKISKNEVSVKEMEEEKVEEVFEKENVKEVQNVGGSDMPSFDLHFTPTPPEKTMSNNEKSPLLGGTQFSPEDLQQVDNIANDIIKNKVYAERIPIQETLAKFKRPKRTATQPDKYTPTELVQQRKKAKVERLEKKMLKLRMNERKSLYGPFALDPFEMSPVNAIEKTRTYLNIGLLKNRRKFEDARKYKKNFEVL